MAGNSFLVVGKKVRWFRIGGDEYSVKRNSAHPRRHSSFQLGRAVL